MLKYGQAAMFKAFKKKVDDIKKLHVESTLGLD